MPYYIPGINSAGVGTTAAPRQWQMVLWFPSPNAARLLRAAIGGAAWCFVYTCLFTYQCLKMVVGVAGGEIITNESGVRCKKRNGVRVRVKKLQPPTSKSYAAKIPTRLVPGSWSWDVVFYPAARYIFFNKKLHPT